MSWIVLLTAVGLLLVLRGRSKPSWLWAVNAALAAIAGAALVETGLGSWLMGLLTSLAGWVAGLVGTSAALVAGVAMLLLTVMVVLDIAADRKADKVAILSLLVLPMLFVVAGGPVADGGSQLVASIHDLGTGLLGPLVGG
jgi:hypothetical protein